MTREGLAGLKPGLYVVRTRSSGGLACHRVRRLSLYTCKFFKYGTLAFIIGKSISTK